MHCLKCGSEAIVTVNGICHNCVAADFERRRMRGKLRIGDRVSLIDEYGDVQHTGYFITTDDWNNRPASWRGRAFAKPDDKNGAAGQDEFDADTSLIHVAVTDSKGNKIDRWHPSKYVQLEAHMTAATLEIYVGDELVDSMTLRGDQVAAGGIDEMIAEAREASVIPDYPEKVEVTVWVSWHDHDECEETDCRGNQDRGEPDYIFVQGEDVMQPGLYDWEKSLIKFGQSGQMIDGQHRLAAARRMMGMQ